MENIIYTHDEAALIVELFESVLFKYNITIPSPENDERAQDDNIGLYGSTYSDLLDEVEENLISVLDKHSRGTKIIQSVFSGCI